MGRDSGGEKAVNNGYGGSQCGCGCKLPAMWRFGLLLCVAVGIYLSASAYAQLPAVL